MFDYRVIKPEVLDHVSPEEARPNLADLVRINTNFGGHSVLRKTMAYAVGNSDPRFSLLDVGAASGDSARAVRQLYPGATITSLDYSVTNLEGAPDPKVIADAFAIPFGSESFDYVLCSLFLHHFEDVRVIELLRSFNSLARKALAICDLERHILPYLFLPATRSMFGWNKITVSDGLKSVRAAFRADELRSLAISAGLPSPEVRVHRPEFRLSMVIRK